MAGYDTHMHSTASDGGLTPTELVCRVKECGLAGMALTDHDTVGGLNEALAAAAGSELSLIPGIELSAEYQERDVHILGYWIDPDRLLATGRLQQLSQARTNRIYEIVRRLSLLGMELDAEEILASANSSPGRPHVAAAMIRAGYVSSVKEAFTKWLSRGMPAFVPREKLSPFEAVELIRNSGGVAALAHPGCGVPDELLRPLVRAGIGGMEVYHPDHGRAAENKYLNLARRFNLAVLGGSDFHVPGVREVGCRCTAVEQLEKLAVARAD